MCPNNPPAYTVDPPTAIAFTIPSGAGFQAVAAPVATSSAARFDRAAPPSWEKAPATYSVVGVATSFLTVASGDRGSNGRIRPSESTDARPARAAPSTRSNCPARKTDAPFVASCPTHGLQDTVAHATRGD